MVAQALCNVNDLILQNIMLARVFITVPHQTELEHYAPHIDIEVDHMVVIILSMTQMVTQCFLMMMEKL